MKPCKFQNCAVCKNVEDRAIFSYILKTSHPTICICDKALYRVTNRKGENFILENLNYVIGGLCLEYRVVDPYSGASIYLSKDNFEVVCPDEGECDCSDEYVSEYIPKK